MLKRLINFPNEFLDFDYIVVNNKDYFPLNSIGGSVLLDRGGTIYEWDNNLKRYAPIIKSKHQAMINESVVALCEQGGYNIPNLKLQKQIAVNLTHINPEFRKRIRMRWRSSRSGSTTVNKWEWDQRNFETNIHMGITPPSPEKGHCCFPCEMLEAVTPIEPLWLRFVSMHDDRRNP